MYEIVFSFINTGTAPELKRPNLIIGVHLAPPCGTASRATEIKRRRGPNPPPLRSEARPDGLKHSYLKKRKREQRDPLTVEQVRKLELLACGDIPGGGSDRLAAWFFLICVYMRARYSDGLNMDGLFIDCPEPNKFPLYGFIEGHVGRSKTAYTAERKTMNLPMVACRRGVSGKDWATPGLVLRQA